MPEQVVDATYKDGQLVSSTPRTVGDAEILKRDAPARLRQQYIALRQWSKDAQDEVAAWDTQTQAQKNAALKVTIDRLGKFFDGMADLLLTMSLDS